MAIIKLTERTVNVSKEDKARLYSYEDVWFNEKQILYMNREETTTRIVTVDGSTLFVKETPEEILALIKEAEK